MTLHLANITFDCDDTLAVGRFWSAVLDRPLDPSDFFASIGANKDGGGASATPSWFFSKVPEGTLSQVRSEAWQVTALPL